MLIIQIALGIVLAVLILKFLPWIIALGLSGLYVVAVLVVVVGSAVWFPNTFAFVFGTAVIALPAWAATHHARKHNKEDAQDLQRTQGKSATGLTWIEPLSKSVRNKQVSQILIFGGGFSVLCFVGAYFWGWVPLGGIGLMVLPFAIYLSLYTAQRQTDRRYASRPEKGFFGSTNNPPTSEATEEGRQRGWT